MKKNVIIGILFIQGAAMIACSGPVQKENVTASTQPEHPTPITYDVNDPSSIIKALEITAGGWNNLWEKKDVQFTYRYEYPDRRDVSVERYIFDNEASWARYSEHQVNVIPDREGEVIQCFDGEKASLSLDGKKMDDSEAVGMAYFLRKANYFWFTMNFKLGDPGANHQYLGKETVKGIEYDKVEVSYNSDVTKKALNDAYILYVNPETKLVDRFFFSLPDFGVTEPILLMEVSYEEIDGLKLPTLRKIYSPNEAGEYPEVPALVQTSTEIKFNNGFTMEDLSI